MSGLMGIVFGCSIVYILSRLIVAQRRIAALEQHITRKADDDVVVSLTTRVNSMCDETKNTLSNVLTEVERTLKTIPNEGTESVCPAPNEYIPFSPPRPRVPANDFVPTLPPSPPLPSPPPLPTDDHIGSTFEERAAMAEAATSSAATDKLQTQ